MAANVEVGGTSGNPDLQAAINAANPGDRLWLHGPSWTGSYTVDKELIIEGYPGETVTLYSTSPDDGIFRVQGGPVSIRNLSLDGGGTHRLARLTSNHSLTFENVLLTGGHHAGSGGAVLAEGGVLTLARSTLTGNHAENGGAVAVSSSARLLVQNSRFEDNTASGGGGALWCDGPCDVYDSLLIDNRAGEGGAIKAQSGGSLIISGSRFCENEADTEGGAIATQRDMEVTYSVFWGNRASEGGAWSSKTDFVDTYNNNFIANEADEGSALLVTSASVNVRNSIFVDHTAGTTLMSYPSSSLTVEAALSWANTIDLGPFTYLTGDPLFRDYKPSDCEGSDLHLQPNSPAIGAGIIYDDDLGAFPCSQFDAPADGVDADCDGAEWCFEDLDGDGYGSVVQVRTIDLNCEDEGLSRWDTDCDDTNPDRAPGLPEQPADGIDSNCDQFELCYLDADGDGFGVGQPNQLGPPLCDAQGVSLEAGDCDDDDEARHPGQPEQGCNGVDDDCDPITADTGDGDGDGYDICDGDCDDAQILVNPGAAEICNERDDDCDALIDLEDDSLDTSGLPTLYTDEDGDGYGVGAGTIQCDAEGMATIGGDCDDSAPQTNPGAPEQCENGRDDDCDGTIDEYVMPIDWFVDEDGDGHGDPSTGVSDCAAPTPDAVPLGGDCNDEDPTVHPGAADICDGIDNDCNDLADDGPYGGTWYLDLDNDGHGDPETAFQACQQPEGSSALGDDCDDANFVISPSISESCNGLDDNCDGNIDEGIEPETSWRDLDQDGFGDGEPHVGCRPVGNADQNGDCDDTRPEVHPGMEEGCDGLDNDCDGVADPGCDDRLGSGALKPAEAVGCRCSGAGRASGGAGSLLGGLLLSLLRRRR